MSGAEHMPHDEANERLVFDRAVEEARGYFDQDRRLQGMIPDDHTRELVARGVVTALAMMWKYGYDAAVSGFAETADADRQATLTDEDSSLTWLGIKYRSEEEREAARADLHAKLEQVDKLYRQPGIY